MRLRGFAALLVFAKDGAHAKERKARVSSGGKTMTAINQPRARGLMASLLMVALFVVPMTALAQTRISYHSNRYSPADDVKVGRQAAAEAEQQFPLLNDEAVRSYVSQIGQRLVSAIPPEF